MDLLLFHSNLIFPGNAWETWKMEKFAWIKPFTFWNVLLYKNCRDFGENKNWFETQQSSGTVQQSMCVAALILKWHYSTLQMSCFLCDIHDAIHSKGVWIIFFFFCDTKHIVEEMTLKCLRKICT